MPGQGGLEDPLPTHGAGAVRTERQSCAGGEASWTGPCHLVPCLRVSMDVPLDSEADTGLLAEMIHIHRVDCHREVQLGRGALVEGFEQDLQKKVRYLLNSRFINSFLR